ncbi:MAG: pyridoxamine 5'-phosphate oxidase family protein [Ignavibacterium sp.]|nr:MAG: pyridoxamine 5'-phosphate oxidase family protein [Ignavibacterium sp.]
MKSVYTISKINLFKLILLFVIVSAPWIVSQNTQSSSWERDSLILAAHEIIEEARYCALITLDMDGMPSVRTMDPFTPEENMVIWMGTHSKSRKVNEIRNDHRVSLYYADPDLAGYVVISGNAILVNDQTEKDKRWKKEWEPFYSENRASYLLIKVVPNKLEILSYKHNIIGNPETWRVPVIDFKTLDYSD